MQNKKKTIKKGHRDKDPTFGRLYFALNKVILARELTNNNKHDIYLEGCSN